MVYCVYKQSDKSTFYNLEGGGRKVQERKLKGSVTCYGFLIIQIYPPGKSRVQNISHLGKGKV